MSDRQRYFGKARDWAVDARAKDARLLRTAWTLAGIATAVALLEAVALAFLAPLKTVQPVTLLVDRQTGYVQALDPYKPLRVSADGALTQAFLAQYVIAREGFDRATVSRDYQRVGLWSAGAARAQYMARMPATNPDSPLQRVPRGVVVSARVKSISKLSEGVALVRFDTQMQDRTGRSTSPEPWVSVLRYRYSNANMTFEDRMVNPLGFQVVTYRRDPEAPPASDNRPVGYQISRGTADPLPGISAHPESRASYTPAIAYRGLGADHIPMGSPIAPPASGAGRGLPR